MRLPYVVRGLFVAALLPILTVTQRPVAIASGTCTMGAAAVPAAEERVAVDAINALRSAHGLPLLTVSATLSRAAAEKSAALAAGAPFAHDDPTRTWQQRLVDCGYDLGTYVSENLAAGTETGADTVRLWQSSPPHLANMLAPDARAVGVARARGGAYGWYWTANFGGRE